MNQSDSNLFSFCYEGNRKIIRDPDDEDASLFSSTEMCDGRCELCSKSWGDEN
jgi:hypothetical protein